MGKTRFIKKLGTIAVGVISIAMSIMIIDSEFKVYVDSLLYFWSSLESLPLISNLISLFGLKSDILIST